MNDQVRRFCPAGHMYQLKPTFVRCCSEAKADPYAKPPQRYHATKRRLSLKEWHRIQAFVQLRDGDLCRYCGKRGYEIDHVVSHNKGGDAEAFDNLVWACGPCNRFKGAEKGFTLKNNALRWHTKLVAKHSMFGPELMEAIAEQRLARQTRQGLVGMLQYKRGGAS